jgi:hypothetical protein
MSTNLPFFFSTFFLIGILVRLKLELVAVSSVCFLPTRVEVVDSFIFYLRFGVSSALFLIGGNLVTVLVCDSV